MIDDDYEEFVFDWSKIELRPMVDPVRVEPLGIVERSLLNELIADGCEPMIFCRTEPIGDVEKRYGLKPGTLRRLYRPPLDDAGMKTNPVAAEVARIVRGKPTSPPTPSPPSAPSPESQAESSDP